MLKNLIVFLLLVVFLWFMPEMVLFTRSISDYVYQEAANVGGRSVELKVVKPFFNLPQKFALMSQGIPDMRVELVDNEGRVKSVVTEKRGNAKLSNIESGEYGIRVSKSRSYSSADLRRYELYADSLIPDEELIPTTPKVVTIDKDAYFVLVIPQETELE